MKKLIQIQLFLVFGFSWLSLGACTETPSQEQQTQEQTSEAIAEKQFESLVDAGEDKKEEVQEPTPEVHKDGKDTTQATSCTSNWSRLTEVYNDATKVGDCTTDGAKNITQSLFQLQGITIDNNGKQQTPCIETKCDANYVYVITNSLPHYDFIQTTPNELKEQIYIYRLPIKTTPAKASGKVDKIESIQGCKDAYKQFLDNPRRGTQNEPAGFCSLPRSKNLYMSEEIDGKEKVYRKIPCFGATGFVLSGVPTFGPNEAMIPDPYGNPFVYTPDTGKEPYIPQNLRGAAALDLCFGHTAFAMHYHGINQACFERKSDGSPKSTYATATTSWNWKDALTKPCTKESPIVGWSLDGIPIKGPCVCTKRNANGSCEELRKVRSAYVYDGLKEWGDDAKENDALGKEGADCTSDSDCCKNANNCRFKCKYNVVRDANNAALKTSVKKICTLLDYAWCTNRFVHRKASENKSNDFVYADRCNGYLGANGKYSYHVTASFPFITSCYSYQPSDAIDKAGRLIQRNRP